MLILAYVEIFIEYWPGRIGQPNPGRRCHWADEVSTLFCRVLNERRLTTTHIVETRTFGTILRDGLATLSPNESIHAWSSCADLFVVLRMSTRGRTSSVFFEKTNMRYHSAIIPTHLASSVVD